MAIKRVLLSAVLVLLALVVQVSVLGRMHLPGATPDPLMLVVVGLALVFGPTGGCLVGFAAGLLADLAPPSDHAIGRFALVLCVMGYVAGMFRSDSGRSRSVLTPLLLVGGAAVVSTVLYAAVGALVGDTAARHVGLTGLVASALLYDLLLAPFVVPAVLLLARRVDPGAAGGEVTGPGLGTVARYRTTRESSAVPPAGRKKRVTGV